MADYQLLSSDTNAVLRTADNAIIPFDPANADYQAYLLWQGNGNEPDPPVTASAVDNTFANDPWTF